MRTHVALIDELTIGLIILCIREMNRDNDFFILLLLFFDANVRLHASRKTENVHETWMYICVVYIPSLADGEFARTAFSFF